MGDETLDTLLAMNDLALVYREQGRLDDAEALLNEAVDTYKRELGLEHEAALTVRHNLAGVYAKRGEHARAAERYSEVVEAKTRVLGEHDPGTLLSMTNLAAELGPQEANAAYVEVLDAMREHLAEEHPYTLRTMNRLADLHVEMGHREEAEALLFEAHEVCERAFGATDERTVEIIERLVALYDAWDRPEAAAQWRRTRPAREPD